MRPSRFAGGWRWLIVIALFALVAAACQPGPQADTTTSAPDTTETTDAGEEPEPTPEGFPYSVGMFDDTKTTNFWAYYDVESDVYTATVVQDSITLFDLTPPDWVVTPLLAAGEAVEPVQEGDVWVVEQPLRDNLTWSDGEPITAEDMVFSFQTRRDLGMGGQWSSGYPLAPEDDPETPDVDESEGFGIIDISAPDTYTVRIEFTQRPGLASWPAGGVGLFGHILPEHHWGPIVEENPTTEALYAVDGIGAPSWAGFVISEREPGAFVNMERSENYSWAGTVYRVYEDASVQIVNETLGFDECHGGSCEGEVALEYEEGPFASDVTFEINTSQEAATLALLDGQFDYFYQPLGVPQNLRNQLVQSPDVAQAVNLDTGFFYLAFNMRQNPGDDPAFREAVAILNDREFIANQVLGGAAIPLNSFVNPGQEAWFNADVPDPSAGFADLGERVEAAKQVLLDAGWTWEVEPEWDGSAINPQGEGLTPPDGSYGDWDGDGILELLAPVPTYDPLRANWALNLGQVLSDFGMPLDVNLAPFGNIVDRLFGGDLEVRDDFDMYILGWSFGNLAITDYWDLWASDEDSTEGGFNTPGYANPEFDALFDEFRQAETIEEAQDIVMEMQVVLAEDLPYVPLFTTPVFDFWLAESVQYPFTEMLGGLNILAQNGGLNEKVMAAR